MSPDGALVFDLPEESIDWTRVLGFMEMLLTGMPGRGIMIWGKWDHPRRKDVKIFLWEHRRRPETR